MFTYLSSFITGRDQTCPVPCIGHCILHVSTDGVQV